MEYLGYLAAIFMGLLLGVVGGGGSILTVPILVYFFQQDALTATTGSLFVVGTSSLAGAVMNARRGQVDYRTGIAFALPSFLGVFAARRILLPAIPPSFPVLGLNLEKGILVLLSFAVLMIFASRAMIRSGNGKAPSRGGKKSLINVSLKGLFIGGVTAFVGAGGGFMIVPALVLFLGVPMRTAVGTSMAIITANALFGFAISFTESAMDWSLLFTVTGLGICGINVGHQVATRLSERSLRMGFGYFALAMGLLMLLDQLRMIVL